MVRILFVLAFNMIWLPMCVNAQSIDKNNIYFEVGGSTLLYSVNYERMLFDNDNQNLVPRIGVAYVPNLREGGRKVVGFPIGFSYISRAKKNFFETGFSYSINWTKQEPKTSTPASTRHDDQMEVFSYRIGIRRGHNDGWFMNGQLQLSYLTIKSPAEKLMFFSPFLSFGFGKSF